MQVSVEYGLCEMMNRKGIRADVAPKDGIFSLDISEREAMLPLGTVDTNVERLYKEVYIHMSSFSSLIQNHLALTYIYIYMHCMQI